MTIDDTLRVFLEDFWLNLKFQPDFYCISSRVDWPPRADEKVYLWKAELADS